MKTGPSENYNHLYAIASAQSGYFTAQQARNVGYSNRLQHYHRQRGSWLPIDHGVFRLRHFPPSRWEDLVHWALWSRNQKGEIQATVSHQSAAQFFELADYLPMKVHLTVPRNFRKPIREGCFIHRGTLHPGDWEEQDGFRVTTPYRTLQDLGHAGDRDQFRLAADQAARQGLITLAQRRTLGDI